MQKIQKNFDTKITVIFPTISRTIPLKDSNKIRETNFVKYEPQKAVTQVAVSSAVIEESPSNWMTDAIKDMSELESDFARIEDVADKQLRDKIFKYDIKDPRNDALLEAEMEIFGQVTGVITYDMFKEVLLLKDVVQEMISNHTIENGGFKIVA